jgi:hypothetical protein
MTERWRPVSALTCKSKGLGELRDGNFSVAIATPVRAMLDAVVTSKSARPTDTHF